MTFTPSPQHELVPDAMIVPSEIMEAMASETELNVPNAFIQGLSYTASWGKGSNLSPDQLENIPVGVQDHAIAAGSMTLRGRSEGPMQSRIEDDPSQLADLFDPSPLQNEALATAKRYQNQSDEDSSLFTADTPEKQELKQAREALKVALRKYKGKNPDASDNDLLVEKVSARAVADSAQKHRVSRRLLLAERSKKLTVTCPTTGIVSLIEVPAIPFPANNPQLAKSLVWTSPFADLHNCRGLAQQGISYLSRLDTQVLAGVLLVLADSYELFKFQPFDTGAQKNAILRTAGKHALIDGIIMIETLIHSANCSFLPKLSLAMDSNLSEFGLEVRMQAYLKRLADAIAKPDKDVWDEKKVKPQYPIRPVYTKDVISGQKKISFLARQEQNRAKKEFAEDKKAGKLAISLLSKQVAMTPKLKLLLDGLMSDEGMLVMPPMITEAVCMKLATFDGNANAEQLIKIIKKDRKALILDLAELEAGMQETLEPATEDNESEEDDAAPGTEEAILDPEEFALVDNDEEEQSQKDESSDEDSTEALEPDTSSGSSGGGSGSGILPLANNQSAEPLDPDKLVPPAGLNAWEQLMWKKKMLKAMKPQVAVQNTSIPSTAVYVPSDAKDKLGKD